MGSVVAPDFPRSLSVNEETSGVEEEEEEFLPPPISWFDESPSNSSLKENSSRMTPNSSLNGDYDSVSEEDGHSGASSTSPQPPTRTTSPSVIGEPLPTPSWKEISSQILPSAARELLSSSMQRLYHTARLSYSRSRWQRKYSELGNNTGGYFRQFGSNRVVRPDEEMTQWENGDAFPSDLPELPPFSSLPWVDRQMVEEWRTYVSHNNNNGESEDEDFDRARTVVPAPAIRPQWQKAEACFGCCKTFGPTRLRHHCRLCGKSFCQPHSSSSARLPHLGYDPEVPERVCDSCMRLLMDQNLAERVAWRLARCRDHQQGKLSPYFETGVDSLEEAALRITQAALAMAKSIPLGAQATVAVETVDVLRKYGLNGIYTIMLRQEFLAAADLLRKALGINRTAWPLSVHELSAAIFYALAQHRAMRGLYPEREHEIHAFRQSETGVEKDAYEKGMEGTEKLYVRQAGRISDLISSNDDAPETNGSMIRDTKYDQQFAPVCDPVSDEALQALIFYAPIALNFIYAEKEVDMQLLAAQQGWRLLYAHFENLANLRAGHDLPASAVFVHDDHKILCLACRGTATVADVVTDLRQVAVSFPESDGVDGPLTPEDEWTNVRGGQGVAVCGMSNAAMNLYREHIDSILFYASRGYRIRLTGHSMGGSVAALLGEHGSFDGSSFHCGEALMIFFDVSQQVFSFTESWSKPTKTSARKQPSRRRVFR